MFEHLTLLDWLPIIFIAAAFAVGAIVLAIGSLRTGQYRDPEAAKYSVLYDDSHPATEAGDESVRS